MSDNKKYYYLKLKENFFDTEDMKILESMDNGYLYSNILLKLYLKSLKHEGKLMFKEHIPYNPKMIATITGHNVDVVEKALRIFKEMGIIEILDNGAIYMLDIQNFIGKSSTEADRIRSYREKIKTENVQMLQGNVTNVQQTNNKSTPEIELEIELEKDIEIELEHSTSTKADVSKSVDLHKIMEVWNNLGLSKVKSINNNRLKLLKARIKEYSIDEVIQAIESINNSSFLKGQNNRGWIITFDWFIKPNNFVKVLEGNYLEKEGVKNENVRLHRNVPRPSEETLRLERIARERGYKAEDIECDF